MHWTPGPEAASKLLKSLHKKQAQALSPLRKDDRSYTTPGHDTAAHLFQAHFPFSTPPYQQHYIHDHPPTGDILDQHVGVVTEDLVRDAFRLFKAKKTPGPDGLKPVALLHLPRNILQILCLIYKACLLSLIHI